MRSHGINMKCRPVYRKRMGICTTGPQECFPLEFKQNLGEAISACVKKLN
jgi:hypothetical protein